MTNEEFNSLLSECLNECHLGRWYYHVNTDENTAIIVVEIDVNLDYGDQQQMPIHIEGKCETENNDVAIRNAVESINEQLINKLQLIEN